jgi:hypothetical protein
MTGVKAFAAAVLSSALFCACSLGFGENFSGGPESSSGGADASNGGDTSTGGTDASTGGDADVDAPSNDITRGLFLHHRFDETSGDVVLDSTTKMNNGKLIAGDADLPLHVAGVRGGAISFASRSRIETPGHPSLVITSPFTVAMWVNAPAAAGLQARLLAYADAFDIKLNGRAMQLTLGDQYAAVNYSLPPDRWTHYAVVFANGLPQWFVDGYATDASSVFDGTRSPQMNAAYAIRLANSGELDAPFTGMLDDFRVYDVALTPEEIAILAKK